MLIADQLDVEQDCFHLFKAWGIEWTGSPHPANALIPNESLRAAAYVLKWKQMHDPCSFQDLICHVGDDPRTGWTTWSAHSCKIPTIRRSGSLYIVPAMHRHMTLREMYLAMGFPTFPICQQYSHLSQLYRVHIPSLSWFDMRRALGNSMVVPQVGCVMGCALASVRRRLPKWLTNMEFNYDELIQFDDSDTDL